MDKSGPLDAKAENRRESLISVIDDDDLVRKSTRRLLRSFGFRCEAFSSAEEFLCSGCAGETACLVLDVKMPGMGGLGLQSRLAEISCAIPIIFVTAQASEEEEHRALHAGAIGVLRKPVGKEALLSAIRQVFENLPQQERNEP